MTISYAIKFCTVFSLSPCLSACDTIGKKKTGLFQFTLVSTWWMQVKYLLWFVACCWLDINSWGKYLLPSAAKIFLCSPTRPNPVCLLLALALGLYELKNTRDDWGNPHNEAVINGVHVFALLLLRFNSSEGDCVDMDLGFPVMIRFLKYPGFFFCLCL